MCTSVRGRDAHVVARPLPDAGVSVDLTDIAEEARARGLILVDTKYEFGIADGRLILADERRLDTIAVAFAKVIDAKSPWTYQHSTGVARIAVATGTAIGLSSDALRVWITKGRPICRAAWIWTRNRWRCHSISATLRSPRR